MTRAGGESSGNHAPSWGIRCLKVVPVGGLSRWANTPFAPTENLVLLRDRSSCEATPTRLERGNFQAFASSDGSFLMLNVRLVPLASVVTPHSASAISIVAF